jgi:hypothetical protein
VLTVNPTQYTTEEPPAKRPDVRAADARKRVALTSPADDIKPAAKRQKKEQEKLLDSSNLSTPVQDPAGAQPSRNVVPEINVVQEWGVPLASGGGRVTGPNMSTRRFFEEDSGFEDVSAPDDVLAAKASIERHRSGRLISSDDHLLMTTRIAERVSNLKVLGARILPGVQGAFIDR